jgi:hypothetical protein
MNVGILVVDDGPTPPICFKGRLWGNSGPTTIPTCWLKCADSGPSSADANGWGFTLTERPVQFFFSRQLPKRSSVRDDIATKSRFCTASSFV